MQFCHVPQFWCSHLEEERIRFETFSKAGVHQVKIHGTANLIHKKLSFFSYFHIYCFVSESQ